MRIRWKYFIIFALLLLSFQEADAADKRSSKTAEPGAWLFEHPQARKFSITIVEPHLAKLLKDNRAYVQASFSDGEQTFTNVAVHLKGMGSFRPFQEKPSLAVKFDHYDPSLNYYGLTKLMLNNASQDATYFGEFMGTALFRDAGVPSARVTHARVEINGRDVGPYVVIEAMNKTFLRRFFKNPNGNLYEAYTQDVNQQLDQDSGTNTSQSDLKALAAAAGIPKLDERLRQLETRMDVDRFLTFTALEMFTGHSDGYALNKNNYRVYHDPTSERIVFITHGLDWAFSNTGVPITPPMSALMVSSLFSIPEIKGRYRERVEELFTNHFRLEIQTNRLQAGLAKLKTIAKNSNELKEFDQWAAAMNARLLARHQNLAQQLSVSEPIPLKFNSQFMAELSGWKGRVDSGSAALNVVPGPKDELLQIQASDSGCVASFRTRVILSPGKYFLVGEVRTQGVVPSGSEPGQGAGLRISGGARLNYLTGAIAGKMIEYPFEITPPGREVELVCELRAAKGQAQIVAKSLHLVRR